MCPETVSNALYGTRARTYTRPNTHTHTNTTFDTRTLTHVLVSGHVQKPGYWCDVVTMRSGHRCDGVSFRVPVWVRGLSEPGRTHAQDTEGTGS